MKRSIVLVCVLGGCWGARTGLRVPDVDRVAYNARGPRVGEVDLYTVRTDVADAPRQVQVDFEARYAAWSPNGTQMAILNASAGGMRIEVLDVAYDGRVTARRTVASNLNNNRIDKRLAWGRNGLIAFHQTGNIGDGDGAIYTVEAAGGAGQRPTLRAGGTGRPAADNPSWCPDGRMVFDETDAAGTRVMILDVGLASATLVTGGRDPDCSQDYWAIVFERAGTVWFRDLQTGAERQVTDNAAQPVFGPESRDVAFVRGGQIIATDLNGGNLHVITPGPADHDPDWGRVPGE